MNDGEEPEESGCGASCEDCGDPCGSDEDDNCLATIDCATMDCGECPCASECEDAE